jgi:hypothetical protein
VSEFDIAHEELWIEFWYAASSMVRSRSGTGPVVASKEASRLKILALRRSYAEGRNDGVARIFTY